MLKVANKRSFDAMALETPMQNVQGASLRARAQWMSFQERSPKRARPEGWSVSASASPMSQENMVDVAYVPSESDIAALCTPNFLLFLLFLLALALVLFTNILCDASLLTALSLSA